MTRMHAALCQARCHPVSTAVASEQSSQIGLEPQSSTATASLLQQRAAETDLQSVPASSSSLSLTSASSIGFTYALVTGLVDLGAVPFLAIGLAAKSDGGWWQALLLTLPSTFLIMVGDLH